MAVSSDRQLSLTGVHGSELSAYTYRARSPQLANADRYCEGN